MIVLHPLGLLCYLLGAFLDGMRVWESDQGLLQFDPVIWFGSCVELIFPFFAKFSNSGNARTPVQRRQSVDELEDFDSRVFYVEPFIPAATVIVPEPFVAKGMGFGNFSAVSGFGDGGEGIAGCYSVEPFDGMGTASGWFSGQKVAIGEILGRGSYNDVIVIIDYLLRDLFIGEEFWSFWLLGFPGQESNWY